MVMMRPRPRNNARVHSSILSVSPPYPRHMRGHGSLPESNALVMR